jgi:acetyl/propionyl-CoA carboxylase alpha subunit
LEGAGEASKILIANRGEIAVRIIRTARRLGIQTVAVYAADDAHSLHVKLADKAVLLSGGSLAETYLDVQKIIRIARQTGAGAIHPGYGFLSENAGFAQAVVAAGLIFIGPSPENIRLMGEKNKALAYVQSLGVPVLPSFRGTRNELARLTETLDYPVIVKASAGGGGKGMFICNTPDELHENLERAERAALSYFGNGELFVEKYLPRARHIEVQLLADHFGNVVHLFERECSVQRRFQKILEEAPSPSVSPELREKLTSTAVQIARSMNYRNAGTIEFLFDENGQFYFLEMNTRIQVEHPVTELVTGIDLVAMQILIATGKMLPVQQSNLKISGHAIEVRLCAEDAAHQFRPSAGQLGHVRFPEQKNTRIDTFIEPGLEIPNRYDSLLAKVIVHQPDRQSALIQLQSALQQTVVAGIQTNLSFLQAIVASPEIQENRVYTRWIDQHQGTINQQVLARQELVKPEKIIAAYLIFHFLNEKTSGETIWQQIGWWQLSPHFHVFVNDQEFDVRLQKTSGELIFQIDGQNYTVTDWQVENRQVTFRSNEQTGTFYLAALNNSTRVHADGVSVDVRCNEVPGQAVIRKERREQEKSLRNQLHSELFGKVLNVHIKPGDRVSKGQALLVLESMKTEIHVLCPANARIKTVHAKVGEPVTEKQLLIELEDSGS